MKVFYIIYSIYFDFIYQDTKHKRIPKYFTFTIVKLKATHSFTVVFY